MKKVIFYCVKKYSLISCLFVGENSVATPCFIALISLPRLPMLLSSLAIHHAIAQLHFKCFPFCIKLLGYVYMQFSRTLFLCDL